MSSGAIGSGVPTNGRGVEDFGSAGRFTDHVHQHWLVLKIWEGLWKETEGEWREEGSGERREREM